MARQRLLGALICSSGAWLGPFSPGSQRPAAVSLLTALTANHKELCMTAQSHSGLAWRQSLSSRCPAGASEAWHPGPDNVWKDDTEAWGCQRALTSERSRQQRKSHRQKVSADTGAAPAAGARGTA